MSSSQEIEIKFRIADCDFLIARLRQLGLQQITPRTHEMNTLFDLPGHPLKDRGDILRLRKYGKSWLLTHKTRGQKKAGAHKVRTETETGVDDGEKMQTILYALEFEPCFRYEKFRAEWKAETGHVVIDETPIGDFAEIEGPAEWIDSMARDLGVNAKDYITETYAGLFSAWKRRTGSKATEMTFEAVRGSSGT